ncbi:M50 family metallopeptidase [Methanocella conradii]
MESRQINDAGEVCMERNTLRYAINAIGIFGLIILFAYITTYIHEIGHALMIILCGGDVLEMGVKSPLSFDTISGYILTNLPYNVPIVIGGMLATTAIAIILCFTARRTIFSYLMLCLSVCTLYNAAYSLSGFNDFTWLVTYSWWSAMLSLGFVLVNLYIAQLGLNDLFDDIRRYRTLHTVENLISTGKQFIRACTKDRKLAV